MKFVRFQKTFKDFLAMERTVVFQVMIIKCCSDLFFTKLGLAALRYKKVKAVKTKKKIKLKIKNLLRIELELKKLGFIN